MEQEYYYSYTGDSLESILVVLKSKNPEIGIKGKIFGGLDGRLVSYIISSQPIGNKFNEIVEGNNVTAIGVSSDYFNGEISHAVGTNIISENAAQEYAHDLRLKNPNAEIYMDYDHNTHIGRIRSNIPLEQLNFYPLDSFRFRNQFYGINSAGEISFSVKRVTNVNLELINGNYHTYRTRSKFYGSSNTFNQNVNENNDEQVIDHETVMAEAQRISAKRLRIAQVNRTINAARSGKIMLACLAGISAVGLIAATEYAGLTEQFNNLKPEDFITSLEAWKDLFSKFTPAMWVTFGSYIVTAWRALDFHFDQRRATQQLYDEENYDPNAFAEEAETRIRNR